MKELRLEEGDWVELCPGGILPSGRLSATVRYIDLDEVRPFPGEKDDKELADKAAAAAAAAAAEGEATPPPGCGGGSSAALAGPSSPPGGNGGSPGRKRGPRQAGLDTPAQGAARAARAGQTGRAPAAPRKKQRRPAQQEAALQQQQAPPPPQQAPHQQQQQQQRQPSPIPAPPAAAGAGAALPSAAGGSPGGGAQRGMEPPCDADVRAVATLGLDNFSKVLDATTKMMIWAEMPQDLVAVRFLFLHSWVPCAGQRCKRVSERAVSVGAGIHICFVRPRGRRKRRKAQKDHVGQGQGRLLLRR